MFHILENNLWKMKKMETKHIIFPPSIWNIGILADNQIKSQVYDYNKVLYDLMLYVPHIHEQLKDDLND